MISRIRRLMFIGIVVLVVGFIAFGLKDNPGVAVLFVLTCVLLLVVADKEMRTQSKMRSERLRRRADRDSGD